MRWQSFIAVLLAFAALPGCGPRAGAAAGRRLLHGVAYQPRGFREFPKLEYPPATQVETDLRLLRQAGFRSLVTYGSAGVLGEIPKLARTAGFDGMIVMGIWDPGSAEELRNALRQASHADGYCVGNEGLDIRYTRQELGSAMAALRRDTGKPVTTSEPLARYLDVGGEWIIDNSDWLFPIAHPFLAGQLHADAAVEWTVSRYDLLVAISRKRVVLKEVGFPTHGGEYCTEATQLEFFRGIARTGMEYFTFEAFDQPFKLGKATPPEVEHHWGLYRHDGSPKKAARWFAAGRNGQ